MKLGGRLEVSYLVPPKRIDNSTRQQEGCKLLLTTHIHACINLGDVSHESLLGCHTWCGSYLTCAAWEPGRRASIAFAEHAISMRASALTPRSRSLSLGDSGMITRARARRLLNEHEERVNAAVDETADTPSPEVQIVLGNSRRKMASLQGGVRGAHLDASTSASETGILIDHPAVVAATEPGVTSTVDNQAQHVIDALSQFATEYYARCLGTAWANDMHEGSQRCFSSVDLIDLRDPETPSGEQRPSSAPERLPSAIGSQNLEPSNKLVSGTFDAVNDSTASSEYGLNPPPAVDPKVAHLRAVATHLQMADHPAAKKHDPPPSAVDLLAQHLQEVAMTATEHLAEHLTAPRPPPPPPNPLPNHMPSSSPPAVDPTAPNLQAAATLAAQHLQVVGDLTVQNPLANLPPKPLASSSPTAIDSTARDAETVVKNIDAALDDKRCLSQQEMSFCLHTVGAAS